MRYKIVNKQIEESLFIDAPYDSKLDALEDLNAGVEHNCEYCTGFGDCTKTDVYNQVPTWK